MTKLDAFGRIAPLCPHAGVCGGCARQDRRLEDLALWKRDRIAAALEAQGLEAEIAATEVSPTRSRRRARLSAVRTKKGVRIGFRRAGAHEVAPIEECLVLRPEILAARPRLEALTRLAAARSRPIGLWVTVFEDGLDIAVDAAKALDLDLRAAAAAWAETADALRLVWNGEPIAERRKPLLSVGSAVVEPPPAAFLQATAEGEAALARAAIDGTAGAERIADLFAGLGTFALRLAENAEVLAVEGDAALTAALDRAARRADGLKRVVALQRDLFRRPLRAEELAAVEAVVLDPPRAGAEAQMREIARGGRTFVAERIVSLSCDPKSFARDARILSEAGWRLGRVRPIDQFLWSDHVEIAATLTR